MLQDKVYLLYKYCNYDFEYAEDYLGSFSTYELARSYGKDYLNYFGNNLKGKEFIREGHSWILKLCNTTGLCIRRCRIDPSFTDDYLKN